jgi:hypothetical protein
MLVVVVAEKVVVVVSAPPSGGKDIPGKSIDGKAMPSFSP